MSFRRFLMLAAMLTLSVAAAGHRILDGDGDGVRNSKDMCPRTPPGTPVDNNGCSKQQLDADGDGICNPDRPRYKTGPLKGRSVPTFKEWCTGRDNCKFVHNPSQTRNYAKSAAKKRGDACNRNLCHEACRRGCDAPGANVTDRSDILACTSEGPLSAVVFATRCYLPYLPIMTSPYGCYHPSAQPANDSSADSNAADPDGGEDDQDDYDEYDMASDSGSDGDDGIVIGSNSGSQPGTPVDSSSELGSESGSGSEDYYFEETPTETSTVTDSVTLTPAASPTSVPSPAAVAEPSPSSSAVQSPTSKGGSGGNLGRTGTSSSSSSGSSTHTATIAGVAIGVGLALIALLALLIVRKRREASKPRHSVVYSKPAAAVGESNQPNQQHAMRHLSNVWDTGVNTLTENQVEKIVTQPDTERPTVFGPDDVVFNGVDVNIPLDFVPAAVLVSPPPGIAQPKAIRASTSTTGRTVQVGRGGKRKVRRVVKKFRRDLSANSELDGTSVTPLNDSDL